MTDREYEEEKAMAEINAAVRKHPFSRYGKSDKAFIIISRLFLAIFVIAIIVPMIYIVIASFMDPVTLQNQGITFNFKKWTVTAYQRVLTNKQIWIGFLNAV
ncbi:MAG: carbohydrate ABC transporter permease, partial [Bilifractor sp.]|nr:carbohydrate ABC transporter permease [Bilifractor sp.]